MTKYLLTILFALVCWCAVQTADAKPSKRSQAQMRAYLKSQGLQRVPRGYQVDHIVPLCAGGADAPHNTQLLTVEQHREKTREDVRMCRRGERGTVDSGARRGYRKSVGGKVR